MHLEGVMACTFMDCLDIAAGHAFPQLETLGLFGVCWAPEPFDQDYRQCLADLLKGRDDARVTPITRVFVEEDDVHTTESLSGIVGPDIVHVLEFLDEDSKRAFETRW